MSSIQVVRSDPQWARLYALSARQHGLATLRQADSSGLPESTLRLIGGRQGWEWPAAGVFALPGSIDTPRRRLTAILLRVGQPAALTGWTAAWLHGLTSSLTSMTSLLLPEGRRAPALPRVSTRRTRRWMDNHTTEVDDLTVVTVPRMLCDLAATVRLEALRPLLIDARQRGLTTHQAVRGTAAHLGNAKGTARIRELLRQLDPTVCDSELEWLWRELLVDVGMRPDAEPLTLELPGARHVQVDIPFAEFKVGLETDGFGSHGHRAALDRDALRHNALMQTDWVVFRATWEHLRSGAEEILSAVRSALVSRGWTPDDRAT
jgi:hypothetical protein